MLSLRRSRYRRLPNDRSRRRRLLIESLEDRRLLAVIGNNISVGESLRVYRTAIAVTGEYTQFFGSQQAAQAELESFVDRANEILEVEQAVRLELVDAPQLIYPDPATDPYDASDAGTLLQDNLINFATAISPATYDVGHLLHAANLGGVAYLSSVGGALKAGGVSTSSDPSDDWMMDVFLHELGHQFSAGHTFNSEQGGCNGNRMPTHAYEPGAGTTVMSYGGSCGIDNIIEDGRVNAGDTYFHAASFESFQTLILTNPQAGPVQFEPTGNRAPQVDAGADYTIPAHTPFQLTATGSDPDYDDLLYTWEQIDLGPARMLSDPDDGQGPLFRSRLPDPNPTRIFPQLPNLLAGQPSDDEQLPSTNRQLNFRATVRDGRSGVASDDMAVEVRDTGAAFAVTTPAGGEAWSGGASETITWDVAGTDAAPIGADRVVIELSPDGGQTWPFTLAETDNDGQEEVTLPNVAIAEGRIRVRPVDNVFFALSGSVSIARDATRPHVRVSPNQLSVIEGGSAERYEVALSETPSEPVRMQIDGGADLLVSLDGDRFARFAEVEFDASTRQNVWVIAAPDSSAEWAEASAVTHEIVSGDGRFDTGVVAVLPVSIGDDELGPLIGVDFQPAGMNVMPGWTEIDSWDFAGTQTFSNLQREDGGASGVSLAITRGDGTDAAGGAVVHRKSAPPHRPSMMDLDGTLSLASDEPLEFVWSGLDGRTPYEIFVIGLENQGNFELDQTVTITGSGADDPAPFTQRSTLRNAYLIMNDRPGRFNRPLDEDAVTVTATANGEVRISIEADDEIRLAGLAIRPAAEAAPGVVLAPPEAPIELPEGSGPIEVMVSLASPPDGPVVVRPHVELPDDVRVTPSVLTFTESDWRIPQAVQVQAVDDFLADGDRQSWVRMEVDADASDPTYAGVRSADLPVTTLDDESLEIIATPDGDQLVVREGGASDLLRVALGAQPASEVRIRVTVSDTDQAVADVAELTFAPLTWNRPQRVNLSAVDDPRIDGDRELTVLLEIIAEDSDPVFAEVAPVEVPLLVIDDDRAGLAVFPAGGTLVVQEGGAAETMTVALIAEPVGDVTVHVASDRSDDVQLSASSLVFTPEDWDQPQAVSLSAIDDDALTGDRSLTITFGVMESEDAMFLEAETVVLGAMRADDERPGIIRPTSAVRIVEGLAPTAFTVALAARPQSDVVFTVPNPDSRHLSVSPAELRFSPDNWNRPQAIFVGAMDDQIAETEALRRVRMVLRESESDALWNGFEVPLIDLSVEDNDRAELLVSSTRPLLTSEDGETDGFDVRLRTQPTGTVRVQVTSDRPDRFTPTPGELVFTPDDWQTPRPVLVAGVDDLLADGDQFGAVRLQVAESSSDRVYRAADPIEIAVSNADNDLPGLAIEETSAVAEILEGAAPESFEIRLSAGPADAVTLDIDSTFPEGVAIEPNRVTFTAADWDQPQRIEVWATDNDAVDGDRSGAIRVQVDATVSDEAFTVLEPAEIDVTVLDDDTDSDDDGVPDLVEAAGPNAGDANGDGVDDSVQPHVATLATPGGSRISIIAPDGARLRQVAISEVAEAIDGVDTAAGQLALEVHGAAPMESVPLRIVPEVTGRINRFYARTDDAWHAVPYNGTEGGRVAGDEAELWVVDGGVTDAGPAGDGVITVDAGPWRVANPWQNPQLPADVDGDGRIQARDALAIINWLNRGRPVQLPPGLFDGEYLSAHVDVDGNGRVEPRDALLVINEINRPRPNDPTDVALSWTPESPADEEADHGELDSVIELLASDR